MAAEFDLGRAKGRIEIDTAGVRSATTDINKFSSNVNTKLAGLGQQMTNFGKSMTKFVTLPLLGAGFLALREFNEKAKTAAQLEAVIKSTGGAANVTADHMDDLANSLQKVTAFEDDAIVNGANMLLTFTNIRNEVGKGNDVFDQAVETILDMNVALTGSGATAEDARNQALQLGKALNDPIRGITALRRVGVAFTDDQQEMIKSLVESGQTLEAQKIILAELNTEFGDSAKAQAQTPWGQTQQAINRVNEVLEQMGEIISPIVVGLANMAATVLELFDKLPGPMKTVTVAFAGILLLIGPLSFVSGKLLENWSRLGNVASRLGGVKGILGVSLAAAGLFAAFTLLTGIMSDANIDFKEMAENTGISSERLASLADQMSAFKIGDDAFAGIESSSFSGFIASLDGISDQMDELTEKISPAIQQLDDLGADVGVQEAIFDGYGVELDATSESIQAFSDHVNQAATDITTWGQDLAKGRIDLDRFIDLVGEYGIEQSQAFALAQNALDEFGLEMDVTGKKIEKFARLSSEEFKEWRVSVRESLAGATPALDRLQERAKITSDSIIRSFKLQRKQFEAYGKAFVNFTDLDLPDALKQQIIDLGIDGVATMQGFNRLTKKELEQVSKNFETGQDAIEKSVPSALRGLNEDADESKEHVDKLGDTLQSLKDRFSDLELHITTIYEHRGESPTGMARGGISRGRLTLVGERGPELMFLPAGTGILSSMKTLRLLSKLSSGAFDRMDSGGVIRDALTSLETPIRVGVPAGGGMVGSGGGSSLKGLRIVGEMTMTEDSKVVLRGVVTDELSRDEQFRVGVRRMGNGN